MIKRIIPAIILLSMAFGIMSCSMASKRMPAELDRMHDFLTQLNKGTCYKYHYNFERQAPRLYREHQPDSLLDVIEYIKDECGPNANLDITRLLVLCDQGRFDDSLIGSATIPQMLWYRSEREYLINRDMLGLLYGSGEKLDNSHDNFLRFRTELSQSVASDNGATPSERAIGLFYSDRFDSAFSLIQSPEMRGAALQKCYRDFIRRTKDTYPTRGNIAVIVGGWIPRQGIGFLGDHPEIGVQIGGEGRHWRMDFLVDYRFSPSARQRRDLLPQNPILIPKHPVVHWVAAISDRGPDIGEPARPCRDITKASIALKPVFIPKTPGGPPPPEIYFVFRRVLPRPSVGVPTKSERPGVS